MAQLVVACLVTKRALVDAWALLRYSIQGFLSGSAVYVPMLLFFKGMAAEHFKLEGVDCCESCWVHKQVSCQ
jgi:hypothetical protein